MKKNTAYILSMWITILLTLGLYWTVLAWLGRVVTGAGSWIPWLPVLLALLTAGNCFIRKRIIKNWR